MTLLQKIVHMAARVRLLINPGYYRHYLERQGVRIGKGSVVIYPGYIDGRLPYLLKIGENVIISRMVTILTHDAATAFAGDLIKVGRVRIYDHCFIGAHATILCNVSIGPDSIVGAGSVVTRDVPAGEIWGGNPARFICTTRDYIDRQRGLAGKRPVIEGAPFMDPYAPDDDKHCLNELLAEGCAFFCARLPAEIKRDGDLHV
jgi:maltose O-acetyltransferase